MIEVRGARTNNLKDVSLDIDKGRITVFTGVSGSGKSSLVFGTIAAESQRLLNETNPAFIQSLLPRSRRPDVDALRNLSAAIVVDQRRLGGDVRSTVGTATDTYDLMRLLWSRLGTPQVGSPSRFSFNDPTGMCPACSGSGTVASVDLDALLDRSKSLNEGPIAFPGFHVDSWPWRIFAAAGFDNDKELRDFTDEEWQRLLHDDSGSKVSTNGMNMTYEGLLVRLRRSYLSKDLDSLQPHLRAAVERIATTAPCGECGGSRLSAEARSSLVLGRSIAECTALQVDDLLAFLEQVQEPTLAPLLEALRASLADLVHLGLGYLSLDRRSASLSGGESQRVKMVRHLGSSLTDLTYVFDEPTTGLHPHDVRRVHDLLVRLRDKGNTVLVVEHDPQVIALADAVVDLGPRAGTAGGEVVFQGTYEGLRSAGTLTGDHLTETLELREPRTPTGWLRIEHAALHNLQDVTVELPLGVLTVVTGVAGSGKSSLVRGCLPKVRGDVVVVDQDLPRGSRRSNPATWTGMLDAIRKAFAKANGVPAALFSANSDGACPTCNGLGIVYTELARFDTVESPCEDCEGRRFLPSVLEHRLRGLSISDVLGLSVVQAREFFTEKAVRPVLAALKDVGLGYLTLGQPLSTLSGGERQRLKLAVEMAAPAEVYVIDEPTAGLHRHDVARLLGLLDQLVAAGSTVIVVEHDLDVIARADWVVDMGPGAGRNGGRVLVSGPPAALLDEPTSVTGQHLAAALAGAAVPA